MVAGYCVGRLRPVVMVVDDPGYGVGPLVLPANQAHVAESVFVGLSLLERARRHEVEA